MRRTARRCWRSAAGGLTVAAVLTACGTAGDIRSQHPYDVPEPHPATPSAPRGSSSAPPTGTPPTRSEPGPTDSTGRGPAGSGLARFYDQHVRWNDCGADTCASVWVPLDYRRPDGVAIRIAVKRQPATQPGRAQTLFVNPGGPGGSGIDYLDYLDLGSSVTAHHDVVGFDPRGVDRSSPIECVSDPRLDSVLSADPSPDTPAEIAVMRRLWHGFTTGCIEHSRALLQHVSTIEAARDMDILRAVVGDPRLNYYGASYGTYLGATYAALFPKRVGSMVLDGAIDPTATAHQLEMGQTRGFQSALTAYLRDCVDSGSCPLGDTVAAAQQRIVSLLQHLDRRPLLTTSGRKLTEGLAFYGLVVPLYSQANWPIETQVLEQALQGDGDGLLYLSDQYADRAPDGHYTTNSFEAQSAINCLDHPEHESVAAIQAGSAQFERLSPVFGPAAAWFPYGCSHWPVQPTLPRLDYSAPGAAPILVVGTTNDPATPYQQAVRLAQVLDSGVLLTRVGDGHTAYSSGNECIRKAVDRFLVTATPPPDGTRC